MVTDFSLIPRLTILSKLNYGVNGMTTIILVVQ